MQWKCMIMKMGCDLKHSGIIWNFLKWLSLCLTLKLCFPHFIPHFCLERETKSFWKISSDMEFYNERYYVMYKNVKNGQSKDELMTMFWHENDINFTTLIIMIPIITMRTCAGNILLMKLNNTISICRSVMKKEPGKFT